VGKRFREKHFVILQQTEILATEEDDAVYRPWRNDSSEVCVIFNIAPEFVNKNISISVNAKTTNITGDVITTLNVIDSFVSQGFTFKILGMKFYEFYMIKYICINYLFCNL